CDPGARRFHYVVDGRFGATAGANGGVTVPFQIAVQARMAIGPVAPSRRVRALLGEPAASGDGGGGGGGADKGGGAMPADFAARVAVILPSPISPILGLRDSLRLSADQVRRLRRLADSLDAEPRSVTDSLQAQVDQAGGLRRIADSREGETRPVTDSVHAQVRQAGEHPDPGLLDAQRLPTAPGDRARIRAALERARDTLTPYQWASLPDTLRALVR